MDGQTIKLDFLELKKTDKAGGMDFVLSDSSVNRYGSRVLTEGINLEAFKQNPVMLWGHNRYAANGETNIIGRWENIRVEGDQLIATAVFDEGSQLGKNVKRQVEQGFVKAVSIGFYAKKWSNDPFHLLPEQTDWTITEADLIEVSFVDAPANPNAVKKLNFILPNPQNHHEMKTVAITLGLPEGATEMQVMQKVAELQAAHQNATTENATLKAKLVAIEEGEKKRNCEELVSKAISEGRITEAARPAYINYAMTNFEECKANLDKLPAYKPLSTQIETAQSPGGAVANSEVQKFQAMSAAEKTKLAQNNPEEHQRLTKLVLEQAKKDGKIK